jgi:hypothetical protein
MGWDEIRIRAAQALVKRCDALQHMLGVPVSPVDGRHSETRPATFFFEAGEIPARVELVRRLLPDEAERVTHCADRICAHRFDLLGYSDLDNGSDIDWHLDVVHGKQAPRKPWYKIRFLDFHEVGDSKITWELNRHQHLVTLARAYCYTGNAAYANEIVAQWQHWCQQNPYPIGINWASSLEVAFRALSWLWVKNLLATCPAIGASFWAEFDAALALHGRHIRKFLSSYFSPNTHLLGEAVGLFLIGTLYSHVRTADEWRNTAWRIILEEARRQVLPDGMHFEHSVYYHVYALDFFLHARILAARNDVSIPPEFDDTLLRMLEALTLLGSAGPPARFGDDDGGRVFDPGRNRAEHLCDSLATGAALFSRPDFKAIAGGMREETLWLLGPEGVRNFENLPLVTSAPRSGSLPRSGIYILADAEQREAMIVDAGSLGIGRGGHGHADLLSVVFSAGGHPWLIDPGTFEYVGPGRDRELFRETAAHNTLRIDGRSQADPGGAFDWHNIPASTVRTWITGETFDLFAASHDGYARLPEQVVHRRWIFRSHHSFWLVRDRAEGHGMHDFELNWLFAPGVQTRKLDARRMLATRPEGQLAFLTAEQSNWRHEIASGWFSPAYGCKQPIQVFRVGTQSSTPVEIASLWLYARDRREIGNLELLRGANDVHAYRYASSTEYHFVAFADDSQPWSLDEWRTDAHFLYCAICAPCSQTLVLLGGSFLDYGGQRILSLPRAADKFEYEARNGTSEVHCPGLAPSFGHSLPQCFALIGARYLSEVAAHAPQWST